MTHFIYDGLNMCCSECSAKTQIRIPHHNPTCSSRETIQSLTQRERIIAISLGKGKTVKDVAVEFGLSVKTVQTHQNSLYRKLNIHSRVELIQKVMDEEFAERVEKAVQEKLASMHPSDVSPKSPKLLASSGRTLSDVKQ